MGIFILLMAMAWAGDLNGIYITHIGDSGRQSIVEFFKHNGKYYAYGFANVDGSKPKKDIHNPNPALKERFDKGTVFVYDLVRDGNTYKNGKIYNFDNGKTYYLKITLEKDDLKLRASIDKSGLMGETLIWKKLSEQEAQKYLSQKPSFQEVLKTIPKE
ncbi:hypothetical protein BKH41_03920 [Helicobacter sp. 12S02232-10]|nr:hypothetical protein BKH41_03920 [Helicobacter sp. 12S02232-10]